MPQQFTFRRYQVRGTHFSDLNMSVQNGDKFDIYENDKLAGTLIDDNPHATGLFRGGKLIRTKVKSILLAQYAAYLEVETGQPFANFKADSESSVYFITFLEENITYHLRLQYNSTKEKYRFTAEFHIDGDVYCQIDYKPFPETGSWFKKRLSDLDFKGVIQLADGLSKEHLLGFLFLLNQISTGVTISFG